MWRHLVAVGRLLKRWLSRKELAVRLLGLPPVHALSDDPGLILLQIDGLARPRLERAIKRGRLPFLKSLLRREGYQLRDMYSGQPATTPAVLAELFYGVEQAVPAFSFRDHRSGKVVEMLETPIAEQIQSELSDRAEGLLTCGAAYCDIYSGGADDAQFCPGRVRWKRMSEAAMWAKAFLVFLHIPSFLRLLASIAWESWLVTLRLIRRSMKITDWWAEIRFIPRHLVASIVLKDATTLAVETDAIRGVQVLHANFLGYDDVAHHAGPDSEIAMRALREVDRSIERIWKAAHSSHRRNYQVWIMADHGQEACTPYEKKYGEKLPAVVQQLSRVFLPKLDELLATENVDPEAIEAASPLTVAIGPLGFIYWPQPIDDSQKRDVATRLVKDAHVPYVLTTIAGQVHAWTVTGDGPFEAKAEEILGADHPHLELVQADLPRLCSHIDAGNFVVGGFVAGTDPLSFVNEHGAHGGPGPLETCGFVLRPHDAPEVTAESLRPVLVRESALEWLGRRSRKKRSAGRSRQTLRVATYNVHGCVGLDGRLSPARIARVLAALDADVIALQELDVGRRRSGALDQAQLLADKLEMQLHFGAAIDVTGERYGNAILSRWPMTRKRAALLPALNAHCEPRGAVWASVDVDGQCIDVVSTHFGLSRAERTLQAAALLADDWPLASQQEGLALLCGDLNSSPGSQVCRDFGKRLVDVQQADGVRGRATWSSSVPLRRIDHIFAGRGFRVLSTEVPRTRLTTVASDHLPLVAELEFVEAETPDQKKTGSPAEVDVAAGRS